MNVQRLFALSLIALLTVSGIPLDAQQFAYSVKLLNLDYQSGPLSAGIKVGDNYAGTPYTPFGEVRDGGTVYTDTYESAEGDIEDTTGKEHSRFSGSDFGNYVIALPNRGNIAVNSKDHSRGMFNLTSAVRKMTVAELNGPSFTATVNRYSAAQYPNRWKSDPLAGFTPGDGTWWVINRRFTYSPFDLFVHVFADTLVVGVEGDVFGTGGTKVDLSRDSAKVRLVNTSRQQSLYLEIVDWRTDTVAPFVASGGRVIPFGEKQLIIRRGDEVLFDTVLEVRPYGFYDLVVLQADEESPSLRIDERLVDRVAARVYPNAVRPDGTTPYWHFDVRTVKQETGVHARTTLVLRDSTAGAIKKGFLGGFRYLDLRDEFYSRIARYRVPEPDPFQKTYLITEADDEVAAYWYDEFAADDQSLSELEPIPLSTLSLTVGIWNFSRRPDSMALHLSSLQMRDTVGSMVAHFVGTEVVPGGTDFTLRSTTGGLEAAGVLDGPGGGNAFLLADDDPAGGIRTVVLGTQHGGAPGKLGFVNFTEGIGTLFLYRSSIGTGSLSDSIPEGESLVFDVVTPYKDTIVVVTPSGDTLGTYRKDGRDASWYYVFDGHREDGIIWRHSIHEQRYGPLRGDGLELSGTGMVAGAGGATSFSLRPVPGVDWITVDFTGSKRGEEYLLSVVDVLGRVVLESRLQPDLTAQGSIGIDCSTLPTGTYYFVVSDREGGVSSVRVPILRR